MPLSPIDEFLAHQTPDTFDHVATSDRNFYDRYYFNMHSSSDELFVIIGLGQYPNLGVTDAFITVSIGSEQHTVRRVARARQRPPRHDGRPARRSRSSRASRTLRIRCDDNEWGVDADLTFTGVGRARSRSPTRSAAATGASSRTSPATRRSASGRARSRAAGPHLRRHARPLEGRARPLVGRPPGRRARGARASGPASAQDGYGFRHDWLPMQFDDHMLKVQIDQDADGHRHRRGVDAGVEPRPGPPDRAHRSPEVDIDYISGTREIARRRPSRVPDPDGQADHRDEHAAAHAVPRRRLRLRRPTASGATASTRAAEGRGHRARPQRPRGAAPLRRPQRDAVPLRDSTPARSATACTRTCSSASTARPASDTPDAVAP